MHCILKSIEMGNHEAPIQLEERFHRIQQVTALSLGLDILKKLSTTENGENRQRGIERIRESVFSYIPNDVTAILVGEEIASRPEESIEQIPEDKRRVWTLVDMDQYAAAVARTAGIRWERKFPSKPPLTP